MHKATQPDLQVEPISRFALLANAIPLLAIAVIVSVATVLTTGAVGWTATFVALLYVLPPVTARIVMALFGKPQGRDLRQDSTAFKVWWVLLQLQMPFNRIPWLEELLRLVPGLYPFWLNLWGAKVNPASFWAPGARSLDRPYLEVAYGSVIGTEALISGHLSRIEDGRFLVDIAAVSVGSYAVVGARSSIGPGCVIAPGETLTALSPLPPYTHFINGKRQ
ncbi:hypothetical protein [Thiosocius teredinicola]|uniref:hypothetical protein n=1 Tax=Thiosocius teredinicola TaxID=1973002 RepID=UPI000990D323